MLDRIKQIYDYDVTPYWPQVEVVAAYFEQNSLNVFYDSIEMHKE